MNEKQLKDAFKSYKFSNWKTVLDFVFGKIEYFSSPNNPFSEDKKVVSGKQYGRIKLDDGKSIALFEVQVEDDINIDRNRQGLREIAARHIDQNITHGALVFFHSPTQAGYRLTFIAKWSELNLETGQLQKRETQKKRYTYLLGKNESGTTAAKRLLELANRKPVITINNVVSAFSVEPIKKEFFKKYKEHYERFWRYLDEKPQYQLLLLDTEKQSEDDKRKPIRDFSKKLLGRIVFLHFLQKKGWMGCPDLGTKKENDEIWENGDPHFMYNLYDDFADKEHFYSKCLTKLFFSTLNEPGRTNNVFSITKTRVPYLNGGLFDNNQPNTDSINFPENYFQELLDFFRQYNFTIDENSPDEQEIGIDPEMLGHIFENLLEENREKGAFYTPKEIVHYMCQESLVQYLKNHLPEQAKVEDFVREQNVSAYLKDKANATQLDVLLDEVKVCDPAIGSGAFPIGILQEIYKAKIHIYPYLKSQTPFDPTETKKKIIEESIYGVDLEHGAVEIARLRFWLALVVDEDVPQPLPNLDYKIMQGNSLLERFEGIDLSMVNKTKNHVKVVELERDLFGNITDSQMKITFTQTETVKEIQSLIKKYFNEKKPSEKAILKTKINEKVHNHIDFNLELREAQLARLIGEAETENSLNAKAKAKLVDLKTELKSFTQKRARLHKIQNTEEKPYFIWHLFFKDVFDRGGFDIVIGNPPYIQLQKIAKDSIVLEEAKFETYSKTGDIYCLFYEKGNSLLKESGVLTFITSNSWLKTNYGEKLRHFFRTKTNSLILINFENTQIFFTATVEVNIFIFKRDILFKGLTAVAVKDDFQKQTIQNYLENNQVFLQELEDSGWIIADKFTYKIKKDIEQGSTQLKDLNVSISYGIKTGFDKAFYLTHEEKDNLIKLNPKNSLIIKPVVRGKDVNKFTYHQTRWLINSHNGLRSENLPPINIPDEYPEIYSHLKQYKSELIKRVDQGNHWTNLRNCAYLNDFLKPKIIWAQLTDSAKFAYDESGVFANAKVFILVGDDLKFLLGILNSKLGEWYFSQIATTTGVGTNQWSKDKVEMFPIKFVSAEVKEKITRLVDYLIYVSNQSTPPILKTESNNVLFHFFMDILNLLVFGIYFDTHTHANDINIFDDLNMEKFPGHKEIHLKKEAVQRLYFEYFDKSSIIRNKILVSESRSEILRTIHHSHL